MIGRDPPAAVPGQRVLGEPRRLRHELAWPIELPDGRRAVIAQLAPELAESPALRRRWVVDMERLAALPASRLAPTLALGPQPDPRAPDAEPPWLVRLEPPGTSLEQLLARAPLPVDEAVEVGAGLADAVQTMHGAGAVLRDLDPRSIVVSGDGLWFTDVGHARLAILSSRTASSLLLESSPYMAPEALLETVVDARADVYSIGVVLWRALTGRVPFEASLLTSRASLPKLTDLRAGVPPELANLVVRCLEQAPENRPPTARDVAECLRGRGTSTVSAALVVARVNCQACGAAMRVGLRLCLSCGKQAVQFHRATPGDLDARAIVLHKASDDAAFVATLHEFFKAIANEIPKLNFVVGDPRMYSKSELAQRHRLPAVLVEDLEPATSDALLARLKVAGLKVRAVSARQTRRRQRAGRGVLFGSGAVAAGTILAAVLGSAGALVALPVAVGIGAIALIARRRATLAARRGALAQLRASPAALPASDAMVAAIASALTAARSPDVRARLEELALLVQRLCDARAALGADAAGQAEADRIAAPVRPLVELARTTAGAIEAIDQQLASLDESEIVRALARCDARGEAPELRHDLLIGLDTLRQLEDERAKLFGRLLEITSLLRIAVTLGLAQASALPSADTEVAHALAALDDLP